jgi:hypothetical protein
MIAESRDSAVVFGGVSAAVAADALAGRLVEWVR